jgi:hypothetical protein
MLACSQFALRPVISALSASEFELRLIKGPLKATQLLPRRLKRLVGRVQLRDMFRSDAFARFA